MERLLDTKKLERRRYAVKSAGAFRTAAAAKAPKGFDGLPKQKCILKVPQRSSMGGACRRLQRIL